jgi:hypothetical protein
MGKGLPAVLCILALVVVSAPTRSGEAINLQGRWDFTMSSSSAYAGTVLIDADYRLTWDDPEGRGWRGYVAHVDSRQVEFLITSGTAVAHIHCTIQASDLLHCQVRYNGGRISNRSVLTRTGAGPKRLLPVQHRRD